MFVFCLRIPPQPCEEPRVLPPTNICLGQRPPGVAQHIAHHGAQVKWQPSDEGLLELKLQVLESKLICCKELTALFMTT